MQTARDVLTPDALSMLQTIASSGSFAGAARAMGIASTTTVRTLAELDDAMARTRTAPGPWVIVARVDESVPTVKPPQDCVFIKQRFMAAKRSKSRTRG